MEELMKELNTLNPELATKVQTEITKRNEESKDSRQKKVETDKILNDILEKLGTTKEEAPKVVESKSNEITALMKKLDVLETKYNQSETEKVDAKKESQIVSKLNEFKVKKNFDFMKDSLKVMTKIGESGELLVGDSTLDQYLQKVIDEDVTIVNGKTKKVKPNDSADLYTEAQMSNMTEEEIVANMDKIDASMKALK